MAKKSVGAASSHDTRLHADNPFKEHPVDFAALTASYPDTFGKKVTWSHTGTDAARSSASCHVDWTDSEVVRCLTRTLLHSHFALEDVELPADRLAPALPNRMNYICWVQELLNVRVRRQRHLPVLEAEQAHVPSSSSSASSAVASDHPTATTAASDDEVPVEVVGLDVGVGASCVYPLLGSRYTRQKSSQGRSGGACGWSFVGTDIDATSLEVAKRNVVRNAPRLTRCTLSNSAHTTNSAHAAPAGAEKKLSWFDASDGDCCVKLLHVPPSSEFQRAIMDMCSSSSLSVGAGSPGAKHDRELRWDVDAMLDLLTGAVTSRADGTVTGGPLIQAYSARLRGNSSVESARESPDGPHCPLAHVQNEFKAALNRLRRGNEGTACGNSSSTDTPESSCTLPELSFTMCNPPFYTPEEQVQVNPATVCTGSASEMVTQGGEVAFFAAMVLDSLVLRTRVRWYTSMVGKKSTLRHVQRVLCAVHKKYPELAPKWVALTSFLQGRTNRWAIAWSFHDCSEVSQAVKDSLQLCPLSHLLKHRKQASGTALNKTFSITNTDFLATTLPTEVSVGDSNRDVSASPRTDQAAAAVEIRHNSSSKESICALFRQRLEKTVLELVTTANNHLASAETANISGGDLLVTLSRNIISSDTQRRKLELRWVSRDRVGNDGVSGQDGEDDAHDVDRDAYDESWGAQIHAQPASSSPCSFVVSIECDVTTVGDEVDDHHDPRVHSSDHGPVSKRQKVDREANMSPAVTTSFPLWVVDVDIEIDKKSHDLTCSLCLHDDYQPSSQYSSQDRVKLFHYMSDKIQANCLRNNRWWRRQLAQSKEQIVEKSVS